MAQDLHVDVLLSERAAIGGRQLGSFLEGVSETRDWEPGENLGVVGHSYGTTVAAFAVAEVPVRQLTLLASAGLDPSTPPVDSLKVPAENVWASEAAADKDARLGRTPLVVNDALGPPPGARSPFGPEPPHAPEPYRVEYRFNSEHPVDRRSSSFGGNVFTSEAAEFREKSTAAVTGHEAHPRVSAGLTASKTDSVGYFDDGNSSLRNTAAAMMGLQDEIRRAP